MKNAILRGMGNRLRDVTIGTILNPLRGNLEEALDLNERLLGMSLYHAPDPTRGSRASRGHRCRHCIDSKTSCNSIETLWTKTT